VGGSYYWGASLEFRTPLYFLPKDAGIKVAAFADAGSLWNYQGPTTFPATGEVISGSFCPTFGPGIPNSVACPVDNAMHVRSSVGVGIIWESPFGPLRFDYSFPLTKQPYDRVQQFRFGGGTTFWPRLRGHDRHGHGRALFLQSGKRAERARDRGAHRREAAARRRP